ncbi:MAG: class I tRNA ligase family protein, partial [Nanoarchaeota archaeon]
MENNYNFKESEKKLREFWEKNKIYKFDINSKKPIYSCDTPPPTVSGTMHMGHALAYSQADFIMRYRRMRGFNVFYPWGFDDNGLATERFVEKKLRINGEKMLRPEFISLCLKETKESEEELQKDWAALGISPDWDTAYRTIAPDVIKISQKSFIDLYVKGREYRKEAPTIWCTQCQTAIAQVEMEDKQDKSTFNYIKAKLEDGSYIIFATTRPELFPANVGYSVKKEGAYIFAKKDREIWVLSEEAFDKFKDEWNLIKFGQPFLGKKLIGKKVTLPLLNNTVEITHDVSVKTEFGTGTAYFCTYGGLDDIEWVARHNTAPISIINRNGTLNERCGKYNGMTLKEARKLIIEDLKKEGMLIKVESIDHVLNVHERCGTEVEYIATTQWFIRYLDLKDYFLDAGNKLNWHPKFMQVRYENWVKGLQWDWCISRQRFFGVPFPVWYCKKCGKVMLADEKDLPVDPTTDKPKKTCSCGSNGFEPEKDVLDTWATSSLTPMIATKWGSNKSMYNKISPMSLRNNGHDIITFWLFNTVVKSLLHEDKLPWKDVMINGFVLDPHGKQMHKSKWNAISPL